MNKWSTKPRVAAVLVGLVATIFAYAAPPASAAPVLVVERNTWNVLGLDSNKPSADGPDTFPVGVSVCNTGDAPATDVTADFLWDETPDPLWVDLVAGSPSTITLTSLAAGECTDFYFNVEVVRDKDAQDTSRDYHIEVSSNETATQSTPAGYEVFIEALVEQNRNSIDSIVGPATVYVGKTYTYVLNADTATNGYEQIESFLDFPNHIFQIESVAVTYTAPPGGTGDSMYEDACTWDPDPASATYNSCLSTGKYGGTVVSTYEVTILAASGGPLDITGLIYDFSGSSFHYNTDFGATVLSVTSLDEDADMEVTKTDSADPVTVGDQFSYTATVTNNGPDAADGVTMTDTLPSEVSYVSAVPDQGSCSEAGGVVTCDLGTMANGASVDVVITVDADTVGTATNNVSVVADQFDPDSSNDDASEDTTISNPSTDLEVTKSDSADPVTVGDQFSYTVTVTNNGFSDATGVVLTDTLPTAFVSYVSAVPDQGSCSETGGVVTCPLGAIANGASVDVVITVDADADGTATNSASVTGTETDPDSSNNSASEDTVIDPAADLAVVKVDATDPVTVGDDITYTVTVTNNGPDDATGVTVVDTLPTAFVSYTSATPDQGSCSEAGGTVTCNLGDIVNGASVDIVIVVASDEDGTATNDVSVSGNEADLDSGNDDASEDTVIDPAADLEVVKVDSADPVALGDQFSYTVTVTNNGPDDATGVTVTDTLPTEVSFVSAVPDQGTCSETVGVVTCTLGAIVNAASVDIVITVDADEDGTVTNNVSVSGNEDDPDPGNDDDTEDTTIDPAADLAVVKVDAVDPVTVGDDITYTVTVTNNGPDDATGVTVTDSLPAEVTYQSATPEQGSCSEAAAIITCTLGDIANGDSVDITIVATADSSGTATNDVSVSGNEDDPDSSNDDDSEDTAIDPAADLEVVKVDATDPVTVGDDITYTVTVTNNGPDDATGVTTTDTLPGGVTYQSATPDQGSCSETAGVVTCSLGDIANGDSVDITIIVTTSEDGTVTNDVSVTGNEDDPDSSNDDDTEDTTIDPAADLEVVKVDATDPVTVGDDITYTVTVTNNGPDDATGVTVIDTLPTAFVSFTSATPDQGSCSEASGTVTCNLGAIADGASVDITIVVTADSDGTATNDVSVSGNEADLDSSNDSDSEDTTINPVNPETDLEVEKVDAVDPVTVGDDITYTVTVSNNGPDAASGVVVTDTLPGGVTYQSATPNQGSCSEAGGVVTCNLGAILNGDSVDIVIVVTADSDGSVTNNVSVTGNEDDPDSGNDSASEDTTIDPAADLAVVKIDAVDPVTVGDDITYTATVTNNGPDNATGVVVTDTLPAEVSYQSATPDQGSCSEAGGVVTCNLGAIANGASVDIIIVVTADSTGTATNDVSVTGNEADLNASNDDDTEDTTINAAPLSADLGVTKSDSADPVIVGDRFSYTVTVTNNGPDAATSVVVTDTLPGEVSYVSAVPDQGSCSEAAGVVTCNLGGIASGDSVAITITVDADSTGTATNDVSVTGNEPDPTSSNDSDTEDTTINTPPPTADLGVSKSDSADPVTVGDQFSYTLTVTNNGPDPATGVTATDTLPGEVSYVSAVPDQGSCSEAAGVITCNLGGIASGDSVDITITVDADTDGTALNSVSVAGDQADSNSGNDSDTENTTINPVPPPDPETDLAVTKSDSVDPVTVGDPLTYTVTVTNNGPDGATGVAVTDTLPSEVTYVSATPSQGSCSQAGGVVTCTLGDIANGDQATITIATTAASAGTATNNVSVTGTEDDPNSANDSDSEDTTINVAPPPSPEVDLAVSKVDVVDPVSIGDSVTYTVTVTNNGPDDATGVVTTDTLPAEVSYVSATPDQGSCSEAAGVVTCTLGDIANGDSVDITIVTTADTDGSALNSVSVTGDQTDSNGSNDSDTETTTINPPPPETDLAITKTDSVDPVTVGDPVTYTVTVTNNGPDDATGVTAIDTLPGKVTYVSATPSQGTCSQAGGVITCTLGAIANGDNATITITGSANSAGTATNNASVSGDQADPNASNDSDSEDTTINSPPPPPPDPEADVAVAKVDTVDPVTVGDALTYLITITNNGPDGATGVTVTDTLPTEVFYVSASPTQGSCTETGGVVTCDLGAMANGDSVEITIVTTAHTDGVAVNSASVSIDQEDPDPSNDSDTEDTTINAPPPPPADPSSIGDTVFFDSDADGAQDPGEPGFVGVTVRLLDDGSVVIATTVTGEDGAYQFDSLAAGDYSVEVVLPTGTALTTASSPWPVSLPAGQTYEDADFGLIGTGSIGQVIWEDTNENGSVDAGEAGAAGVAVTAVWGGIDGALGTADDLTFMAVTGSDGKYTITGLPGGLYQVIVDGSTLPAGYKLTYTPDGDGNLVDTMTLGAGETVNDENFGYVVAAALPATGADIDRMVALAIALMAIGAGVAFIGAPRWPHVEERRRGASGSA